MDADIDMAKPADREPGDPLLQGSRVGSEQPAAPGTAGLQFAQERRRRAPDRSRRQPSSATPGSRSGRRSQAHRQRSRMKPSSANGIRTRVPALRGRDSTVYLDSSANLLPIARMSNFKRQNKSRLKEWPYIRFAERENKWMVDARTKDGGSRKFYSTKAEAETFAQQCRTQKENSGTSAFGNAELAKFGKTIQDAIQFYIAHLRTQERSISVEQAITELLSSRRSAGRSERYCEDIAQRLARFARKYKSATVASIDARMLNHWLGDLGVAPGTRNTFRRDLRTLFSFCEKHGYCQTNEAAKTERAKDVDKPAGILTPSQAATLLEQCGNDTLPYVAIGLFSGLRTSELKKLDWSEVDFESGHIEVTAAKSKTARRRLVPITENLAAWIQPLAAVSGPMAPVGLRKRLASVKKRAGISDWPHNALRHSYGSYRLAATHDAARVSLEMGNSPQMVFAHYRELVKPKDAERFWALAPAPKEGMKVVQITAA